MRGLILVTAALVLSGCDDMPRARSKSDIREIVQAEAGTQIRALELRVQRLESDLESQKSISKIDREFSVSTYNELNSLRKTFNGNVDIENKNKARQMTARGGCGQEWVNYPDGGRAWRNKECTVKDLP